MRCGHKDSPLDHAATRIVPEGDGSEECLPFMIMNARIASLVLFSVSTTTPSPS